MEQQVKTIRIKEGKVLVSPMVEPKEPTCIFTYAQEIEWRGKYERELEAYNASFVEVENNKEVRKFLIEKRVIGYIVIDGDYPAPDGLVMTVKDGVATVKFTPAEKEEKPDFEKIAKQCEPYKRLRANQIEGVYDIVFEVGFVDGCNKIWNEYVQPLQQEITTLRAHQIDLVTPYARWFEEEQKRADKLQEENKALRARIAELEKKTY